MLSGARASRRSLVVGALLGTLLVPVAATSAGVAGAQEAPPTVQHLGVERGPAAPEVVPGSVLITRSPGRSAAALTWTLAARGLRLRDPVDAAGVGVVDTGGRPVADVVADLNDDPSVTSVSPNYVRRASAAPNDPLYTPYQRQYAGTVRLPAAWDKTIGSRYVEIAVLDTGIDLDHPDLEAKLLPGWDAVHGDAVPADDNGHGTFVAGVAAGRSDNGTGTAGVAWRSRIIPVKVLAANGSGNDADVVEGIQWAVAHGADVINLSLGGEGRSAAIDQWVDYALDHDVAVVAAAGNDGVDTPNYPAASPGVVSVGATDHTGQLAHFSNWGDTVDLVAPGMDIASTANGGGYAVGDGTSFACPLTAGVLALLRAVEPDLLARDAANRIVNSAKDIAGQGRDPQTGRGLLDAAATVGAKPRMGVTVPGRDALEADGTPDTANPLTATPVIGLHPPGGRRRLVLGRRGLARHADLHREPARCQRRQPGPRARPRARRLRAGARGARAGRRHPDRPDRGPHGQRGDGRDLPAGRPQLVRHRRPRPLHRGRRLRTGGPRPPARPRAAAARCVGARHRPGRLRHRGGRRHPDHRDHEPGPRPRVRADRRDRPPRRRHHGHGDRGHGELRRGHAGGSSSCPRHRCGRDCPTSSACATWRTRTAPSSPTSSASASPSPEGRPRQASGRRVPSMTCEATTRMVTRWRMALRWMKEKAAASARACSSMRMPLARSTSRRVSSCSSSPRTSASSALTSLKRPSATSTAGMSSLRWKGLTR